MKVIELTQGYSTLVDDEDFERLSLWRWKVLKSKDKRYACRSKRTPTGSATILMHKEILSTRPGMLVDHRDGNGLNNQRYNLREADRTQNMANSSASRGTSRYRGVSYSTKRNKWVAQIKHQGIHYFLGRFQTEDEARQVFDLKNRELNGEYVS